MIIRLAMPALLFFVSLSASMAQVKVSGTIIDNDTQDAIEFANIALLTQDSTFVNGASSDAEGLFAFNDVAGGDFILSVSFVGYQRSYIPFTGAQDDIDLGNVALTSSEILLNAVTVTANSVIQRSDRKIIFPSEAQIKASTSGVTLLRNLQLSRIVINPINNTIGIPGDQPVQLRINGVEVTIAEIVSLQPADIIRIEYHDDPGMRYGNAGAVIDYITRRRDSGGSFSADLGNVFFQDVSWGENFLSAKVNHKKSEFGVNGYWSRRSIDWIRENEETFVFPDMRLQRVEEGQPATFKEDWINTAIHYNLRENDKYLFNATLRNNFNETPDEFTNRNSVLYSSDNPDRPLSISDHSSRSSYSPSLDLYYQHNVKNDQLLIFNVVGTYIDSRTTRLYQERRNNILGTDIYASVSGDKYSLITEGIYEKVLEGGKWSAGLKHTQSYTNNKYEGNVSADIGMNLAETYGYIEYQLRKNKFTYTFGAGVMRTYNSQDGSSNEKYIFRPNFRVSYKFDDNAYVRYNGFISGYSPSLSDLNNVEQAIDSLQIRRGNPDLKSVWYLSNALNAGYNKGILGVELYARYNFDKNPMMESIFFEDGKFVRTNVNQKEFHRFISEADIKLKPFGEILTLHLTPGYNYYISKGNDYEHTYGYWRFRGSVALNYEKWLLRGETMSRWNNFWGETMNKGELFHAVSAGYNTGKWSLNIVMFNPFSNRYTQGSRNYSALVPTISEVYSYNLSRVAMVNFTMNLNFGRLFETAGKRLSNDDTDAGIISGSKK